MRERQEAERRERAARIRRRKRYLRRKLCQITFVSLLALLVVMVCFGKRLLGRTGQGIVHFAGKATQAPCRSDDFVSGTFPLFLQEDERWADVIYGSGPMGETGCGPTCLSMVVCALQDKDEWMPPRMAEWALNSGYYVEGSGTAWAMMWQGAEEFGISARELSLDEEKIHRELQKGHPVICIMGSGQFTTEGHYIVLYGEDASGRVKLRDPKSRENSEKKWELEDIMAEIKNLWSYSQ